MNAQEYVLVSEQIRALEMSIMQVIETLDKGPKSNAVLLKSAVAAKVSKVLMGLPIDKGTQPEKAINIVLDDYDAPRTQFVEIETDSREGIGIGEWIPYGNFTRLRITAEDILNS